MLGWLRSQDGWARPGAVLAAGAVAVLAGGASLVTQIGGGGGGVTCDRNATTSTFVTQYSAATAGQTICLASGDYGLITGVAKSSPGVTIRPAASASPMMQVRCYDDTPCTYTTFDGVRIKGGLLCAPSHHVTFKNLEMSSAYIVFVGPGGIACGSGPSMNGNAIVFDNVAWTQRDDPTGVNLTFEGRLTFAGNSSTASGVQVKNSTFDGSIGPCADGVQFTNGNTSGQGAEIGPGNLFTGLMQSACDALWPGNDNHAHVDSIQWVDGGPNVNIHDNWFTNSSHGPVNYDAQPVSPWIHNNVFQDVDGPIHVCASQNAVIEHNTIFPYVNSDGNPGESILNCDNHGAIMGTNLTVRNNIVPSPVGSTCFNGTCSPAGSFSVNNYNLCRSGSCAGANSLNGTPTFAGGTTPSTFPSGFALTIGSLGKGAASDGTDMGFVP